MSSTSPNIDCTSCSGACGYLVPDPDVAGLGVVIAFLTTSSLTWSCAVVRALHWFLNHTSSPNKVDQLLQQYRIQRRALSSKPFSPPMASAPYPFTPAARRRRSLSAYVARLATTISPLLLSLHDTQLASGLAISAAALIRRRNAAISVYHFSVAADLTWIASGTQLVSFVFVRSDIKDDQKRMAHGANTHHIVQLLRATCMTIQLVLLLWISYIQGERRWGNSYACPVSCLERTHRLGGTPMNWMMANFVLVIWTYPVALLPLCQPIWSRWKDFKVIMGTRFRTSHPQVPNGSSCISTQLLERTTKIVFIIWAFFSSMTLEIILQLGWFGYGLWSLVADRDWGNAYFRGDARIGNGCDPVRNAENDWGFGQIFPVMILITLIMTFFQAHGDGIANEVALTDDAVVSGEKQPDVVFLSLEAGTYESTFHIRPQQAQIKTPSPALHGFRNR